MPKQSQSKRISKVEVTDDIMTGRGGMALFVRYLNTIQIFPSLNQTFGHLRKSAKGLLITTLFQQVFCFLFDGTSRHLTQFDILAKDKATNSHIVIELKRNQTSDDTVGQLA